MSYKTTLILLVALVVIGAAVYWQDVRSGSGKKEEPKSTQVFTFAPQDVSSLSVTYDGKSTDLQKDDATKWSITKPVSAEADYWGVENMVVRLGSLTANRTLTGTVGDLAVYGLDRPIMEARIGTKDGKREIIIAGDKTPDGSAYYVKRMNVDTIYLVATSIISDVTKLATEPPRAAPTPTPGPPQPAPAG
ncbi:MAG: DUF4340 domain-containing protein [Chloroflexi bacterium]|nr:DUF4340 domain-containing protein [Chloroflexota bacterium]